MDARLTTRQALLRSVIAIAGVGVCGLSLAGEAIQLPAWVEPGEKTVRQASLLKAAPVPPKPSIESDLGYLLRSTPPPQTPKLQDAKQQDVGERDSAPEEPRRFVPPSLRLVRQLENAAQTAQSPHSLSRLIRRYQAAREQLAGIPDAGLLARADRVGGWAYESRGRFATELGEHSRAAADFRRAIELDPDNQRARQELAISLAESGQHAAALRLLDRVLKDDPASARARRNRASIQLTLGDAEAAITDCDAALSLLPDGHPELGQTLRLRGVTLHALGRLRESAVDLNQAIQLAPHDAEARVARGHVFAQGGFYDQAIHDYADAAHCDPAHAGAYRSLAWSLATCPDERLRDPATAVEAAWRARRLDGGKNPLTLDAAAAAHASAGDYAEAIRLAQQALMTAGDAAPSGAAERLRLYEAGQPYVSRR